MAASKVQIPLKVVIHKQEERVLYAEANSDFVDILFSFLTMPMGTIIRFLSKHSNTTLPAAAVIGSFNNLYKSISNLQTRYFATEVCKDMLLNTRNSAEVECRKLKVNIDDIRPIEYFTCDLKCTSENFDAYVSTYNCVKCKNCSRFLENKAYFTDTRGEDGQGVFVHRTASFVITDDLHVIPIIPAATLALLEKTGFTDFGVLEERNFHLGSTEILDLLKYSILSKTPLTSMFLGKNYVIVDKTIQTITNSQMSTEGNTSDKKMTVKVLVQKSNNKILLAEAAEDFAELLFTFLSIPLGKVISLLSASHSSTVVAENLNKSVSDLNVNRYFKSQKLKNMLLDPKLAEHYYSSNQIIPLKQAATPSLCCEHLVNPKGSDVFMKARTMFMVTDDLVVTPLSSATCFNYLNSLKVPPSDVKDQVVNIDMQEALNLLWATLNTSSVLNNGLKDSVE
ncbi:uncharacterized protein LOC141691207 [Apium graveolens]|uniref:uncharacterized protein LOC141691207 n=1 Tax=Apium graveolens TaxID=4045 RepID=UPI003D794D29